MKSKSKKEIKQDILNELEKIRKLARPHDAHKIKELEARLVKHSKNGIS